jgi:hypothetical protein
MLKFSPKIFFFRKYFSGGKIQKSTQILFEKIYHLSKWNVLKINYLFIYLFIQQTCMEVAKVLK